MLDNTYLSDAWSVGSTVANIQGAAGETGVTLSYALVPGDGSDNNADFTINGTTLRSAVPFNHAAPEHLSYSHRRHRQQRDV